MKKEEYKFHRAVKVRFREGVTLDVTFEDGVVKRFDMASMYDKYPQMAALADRTLFESGQLYSYIIVWNDDLDFGTEDIYELGTTIRHGKPFLSVDIGAAVGFARAARHISQSLLAERVGIDQSDISKIERGVANPSIKTLRKIAEALDCKLVVKLEPLDPHDPEFL